MAARKTLRAVQPDERSEPPDAPKKMSVTEAARSGTPRDLLVAMRDRVATDVEAPNTPSRDLAALTRRLIEISKEIDAIDVRAREEGADSGVTPDAKWEAV